MAGLIGVGLGASLMIDAKVGLAPWDVLHQGIHKHTDIPIGTISILVGLLVFVLWIPLKQRIGPGTLLNVFTIRHRRTDPALRAASGRPRGADTPTH